MNKPVLVIMAAGMGSRYGGLKQIDPIGPNGQIILDYSVYDAHRAGFERVVFIIRPELHEAFEQAIGAKARRFMQVDYAYQTLDRLPEGLKAPEGREKPLGTRGLVREGADRGLPDRGHQRGRFLRRGRLPQDVRLSVAGGGRR